MIMRFRPANISLINRRHYLPRLLLTLFSKGQMQKPPQRFEDVDRVTPYQGCDARSCHHRFISDDSSLLSHTKHPACLGNSIHVVGTILRHWRWNDRQNKTQAPKTSGGLAGPWL